MAENVAVTLAANDALATITVGADVASPTIAANDATAGIGASAENVGATFAANDATPSVAPSGGNASLTATANDATTSATTAADVASFSMGANDATVTAVAAVLLNAFAECVTFAFSANDASRRPYLFTPPIYDEVPPYNENTRGVQWRLARHMPAGQRGRNVFLLNDGTITERDPDGTNVTWDDVDRAFLGGHDPEQVTEAERQLLIGAGYSVDGG